MLKVKSVIRSVSLEKTVELLNEVLLLPDAESINRCLDSAFREAGLNRLLRPGGVDELSI